MIYSKYSKNVIDEEIKIKWYHHLGAILFVLFVSLLP